MRKLILGFFCIACFLVTSCQDDDMEEYYVRYTAIAEPGREVHVSFANETGKTTSIHAAMPDGKFQYAVGPVRRGFKAHLSASYEEVGGAVDFLSVEVAEEDRPFVLKKSYSNNTFDIIYTIE